MDYTDLKNPVWARSDNLRDPAIFKTEEGYHLFYSRYSNKDWQKPENWAIGHVFTKDFNTFTGDHDASAKGYASPGDVIRWKGKYLLPFQSYPLQPTRLCYSLSEDLYHWSDPVFFLEEAAHLPWNSGVRVIDPTLVVDGDRLHCFFVGSDHHSAKWGINLVGHAYTDDPDLKEWTITTVDKALIGTGERNVDGAENVAVFRTGEDWTMIFSEGLRNQHLAYAKSDDLIHWEIKGVIEIEHQEWMSVKYGAPYIWVEDDGYEMILMGENDEHVTTFGLLHSDDGIHWTCIPEA